MKVAKGASRLHCNHGYTKSSKSAHYLFPFDRVKSQKILALKSISTSAV